MSADAVFVNEGLLRDHVTKLHKQKKDALTLYERVVSMKELCDPIDLYKYDSILSDVNQLILYFDKMAEILAHIDDESVLLSMKLGSLILKDTEESYHKVRDSLKL